MRLKTPARFAFRQQWAVATDPKQPIAGMGYFTGVDARPMLDVKLVTIPTYEPTTTYTCHNAAES